MFGLDLERVSTKVISLGLQQVGWEISGTITVIPSQRSIERWGRDAPECAFADNVSPTWLGFVYGLVEEVIEEQVL